MTAHQTAADSAGGTAGPPPFDHRDDGTPEQAWLHSPRWQTVADLAVVASDGRSPTRLVVAVAHPDDESLATAGLLQWARDHHFETHLVMATGGERSHPDSPTHTPADLVEVRRRELADALAEIAPDAHVTWLGLPDGDVAGHLGPLREVLAALVDARTLVVSTWRHDGHTDHDAVGETVRAVAGGAGARHLQAPIWLWHWGSEGDIPWEQVRRLPLGEEHRRGRAQALAAHASQHQPLSPEPGDEPLLGPAMLAHFDRPWDTYVEEPAPQDGPRGSVFDDLHRGGRDHWQLATSSYERRKRAVTLAVLPHERLGRVLEVGCSVGVLTGELAARADHVLGLDVSAEALASAAERLAGEVAQGRAELRQARVPGQWPEGRFDLVVLSEVGYFLTSDELDRVLGSATAALGDDGTLLLVHWRHPVEGWPLDGAVVHARAADRPGWRVCTRVVDDDFEVVVLRRRSGR